MSANADAGAFWAGPSGAKWIEHEAEQDHFLSGVARAVLDVADLQPGERVLDIGCGTGAVSLLAAEAVGSDGRVLATDIAPPFLERVSDRARNFPQIGTHLGDAQSTLWPEADFDAALSRFGVMFFADPPAAFRNIGAALGREGRIAFAAWGGVPDNPYWSISRDLVTEQFGPQPRPEPNSPGPMGLADADWAMAQMRAGGLVEVAVETQSVSLLHAGGAVGVASLAMRIGLAGRVLGEVDASVEDVAAFRSKAEAAFAPYEADGMARVPATIHLFTARVA